MAVAAEAFKNYVGGEWTDAASGETFESKVPATGETLGTFPRSTAEDVDRTALRQHRDMFGPDNWRTLLSINALAEDLNGQGRYQDVLNGVEPMLARITDQQRTRRDRGRFAKHHGGVPIGEPG